MQNGRRIKVLHDFWCREGLLKNSFPSLFSFASNEEAWVVSAWKVVWNSGFM